MEKQVTLDRSFVFLQVSHTVPAQTPVGRLGRAAGWQETQKHIAGTQPSQKMGRGCRGPGKGEQNLLRLRCGRVWRGGNVGLGTAGTSFPNIFPLLGWLCLALPALCSTTECSLALGFTAPDWQGKAQHALHWQQGSPLGPFLCLSGWQQQGTPSSPSCPASPHPAAN